MWSCNDLTTPIYSFNGHNDVVREFLWRSKKDSSNDTSIFFFLFFIFYFCSFSYK